MNKCKLLRMKISHRISRNAPMYFLEQKLVWGPVLLSGKHDINFNQSSYKASKQTKNKH